MEVVKEAALHLLELGRRLRTAVRKAIEQADRGELIDEAEMDIRVQQMFRS
jgi:hypothetical protein